MSHASMGKIMWVDLGQGTIRIESVPAGLYEKVLSGIGLAAHLSYERIPPGADPLGPDNILGFVSGLLTGTGSLFTGRWMVTGKSPYANIFFVGVTLSSFMEMEGPDQIFLICEAQVVQSRCGIDLCPFSSSSPAACGVG